MPVEDATLLALINTARNARATAYAPYSRFQVGAAVLGASGRMYTGCNVENASFCLTVCAERLAILSAVVQGEREIRVVAIAAGSGERIERPCGACLQVMREFAPRDEPLVIASCNASGTYDVHTLEEYLPMPFSLELSEE